MMESTPANKTLPPLSFLIIPPSDKDLHYSQIPLPPSPAPSRSGTSPGQSNYFPPSPSSLAFPASPMRFGQTRGPALTPLSPNFSRPQSYLPRELTSLELLSSPLSRTEPLPLNRAAALSPPRPPPSPTNALKPSKSIIRLPSFFRRPTKRLKEVVRSASTPPATTLANKRVSKSFSHRPPPLPTSPSSYTSPREHRMLAQSMLGPAFPAAGGGRDRMSQWRESVAPSFPSDFGGDEGRGGNGNGNESRESSPAKKLMEEVLSDPKGSMGGWKFPSSPEKEEIRMVEVVEWNELNGTSSSRPEEDDEFEFEFERSTTLSTSDSPKISLGTELSPSLFNRNIKDYSSTPNLSLALVDSKDATSSGYEPSSLDSLASPISLLSPTSVYASPLSPTFPSSSRFSSDDGTRTPRQHQHQNIALPPSSAPPQQTSFARGRSPPSARSKLHRITTFFDTKPVKIVAPPSPRPMRQGLGRSIMTTPVEMARRLREMEAEEGHDEETSKRMESFFM